ncbi:signal peptidase I [Enterococcus sp. LJL99]
MSRKKSVGKNNYSRREDNGNRNERKKVRRPSDRERGRYEYRSNDAYLRERRRVRDCEFAYDDSYERGRRERVVRERYDYAEPRSRAPQRNRPINRVSESPQKSSEALLFSFIWTLFFYTFTIGILMMAVMFSFSSKSSASIFGYRFYTVLTNSMAPQKKGPSGGFYAGDIVILKMTKGEDVRKNDIITFTVGDGSRYLTHRMVDRKDELNGEKGNYIITKGDANQSNDPPITADRVVGKVIFSVPKAGNILDFVREEFWACLVSVLSLYGFFLVLKSYFFTPEVIKRRPMRR